jgi:CheY-like chemotaxis protein
MTVKRDITVTPPRPSEVLLVEDNVGDALLAQESIKQSGLHMRIHHVTDGQSCLAFLRRRDEYAAAPTPDLVLLDLNMPGMSGKEVLVQIASDDSLCHIPVVVLTSSNSPHDVIELYRLRCSSYVVKPLDFNAFGRIMTSLYDYWFTTASLPSIAEAGTLAQRLRLAADR